MIRGALLLLPLSLLDVPAEGFSAEATPSQSPASAAGRSYE